VVRGVGGVVGRHTHTAQHWVQWLVAGKVQTNCVSVAGLITVK